VVGEQKLALRGEKDKINLALVSFSLGVGDTDKILFPFSFQPVESNSFTVMFFVFLVNIIYESIYIFCKWFVAHFLIYLFSFSVSITDNALYHLFKPPTISCPRSVDVY